MSTVTIRQPVVATDLPTVETPIDVGDGPAPRTVQTFPQSVASGGPTPNGIILWTRIDPDRYDPSKSLYLEVSSDRSFDEDATGFEFSGPGVKPPDNYTIRVDLQGLLDPDSVYYYRFTYRGVRSNTGRCRTLPAVNSSPESLRFGVLNCQNYHNGYFGAMTRLAETDVDFVLHLGDYIYEEVTDGEPTDGEGRYADRRIDLPDGGTRPMSLDDFREIYETYKVDPHLRRLHERHTALQTWDDHAIANDRYWDYETDAPVFPDHPCGDVPEFTRYLTRAGIQAWWEFIPARIGYDPTADHIHDSFELYRSLRFGDLVTLLLTDERLYRSRPRSWPAILFNLWTRPDSPRTMLGTTQRRWLCSELRESETVWTVWANAVLFKPLYLLAKGLIFWKDAWSGFESERRAIIEVLTEVRRRGGTNVVVLTGDMHMTLATRLRNERNGETPVGVEFMTPSVTSVNPLEKAEAFAERVAARLSPSATNRSAIRNAIQSLSDWIERSGRWMLSQILGRGSASGAAERLADAGLAPHFTLADGAEWGYSVVEFSREACTWDVYWVDKTVDSPTAECKPAYRIYLPADEYTIRERHGEISEPGSAR
ncbi:alkaline phosphatase D family protein [Halosimplex salinum]|uniref:alkaline phosphatase D family protein n=1 Tax=Halosimplex salinum TaxID=1710538 RepID=UPI0013DDD392|nr:alkaline phosphatase D family protein [Halosimplex salinum]